MTANKAKHFLWFWPNNTYFHVERNRRTSFTFFIFNCIKWYSWFFNVSIFCERIPANAISNNPGSMHWTKFMEITSNTLSFFLCEHSYFDEHKEKHSEFHSSKLAILSQVKWMEISSSLISRSPYEENQDKKSLFGPKGNNLW